MTDEIRTIHATVDSPLLSSGTMAGITLTLAVNSVASANVSVFPAGGADVRQILTAQTLGAMAQAQKARFVRPMKPDSTINFRVNDTNMKMSGFGVSPSIYSSKQRFETGFSVVGEDAALDGIDMSIYQYAPVFGKVLDGGEYPTLRAVFDAGGNQKTGDFCGLLKSVTEKLVSYFSNVQKAAEKYPTHLAALNIQHTLNLQLLPRWYAVLANSKVKYPEWGVMFSLLGDLGDGMINRILANFSQPGGFWGVLQGIFSEFRVVYVPSLSGPGKLVKMEDKMLLVNSTPVDLHATGFTLSDGSSKLLPLGGIMVSGSPPHTLQPEERLNGDLSAGMLARYPATLQSGFMLTIPVPMWVATGGKLVTAALADAVLTSAMIDPFIVSPVAQAAKTASDNLLKRSALEGGLESTFLVKYAKSVYEEVQYSDSKVHVTLAAMPGQLEAGERRLFKTSDGGSFTGFVQSVAFSMSLSADQLSVSAAVELSHVKF